MKLYKYLFVGLLAVGITSCGKDYLDTDYTSGISKDKIDDLASNDASALSGYLEDMYLFMASAKQSYDRHDDGGYMGAKLVADLNGEDVVMVVLHWYNYDYMMDNRMNNYVRTAVFWKTYYTMIAKANIIIDCFPEGATDEASKALIGQALAVRATAYTQLIQIYQKSTTDDPSVASLPAVPMRYAKAEGKENLLSRNTVGIVRSQIEADYAKAKEFLAGYERPYKHYIDEQVVDGLLARYYMLIGDWQKAIDAAQSARDGYPIMTKVDDGFMDLKNSEWMWGFDHTMETIDDYYASFFSHISNETPGYAGLFAPRAVDARLYSTIPDTDIRKKWFSSPKSSTPYYAHKFGFDGNWSMDYLYLRASEMLLTEAEALAHLGRNAEAAKVLKELMTNRDPEWNQTSVTVDDIWMQRRIELWGEGFSYYDSKRLNKGIDRNYAGSNHTVKIAVPAGDKIWLYQLPLSEIQENSQISEADNNP